MQFIPIFVLGAILGSMVTALYIEQKKNMPSRIKIESLEHTIASLKEDIQMLEKFNTELQVKLKKQKTRKPGGAKHE